MGNRKLSERKQANGEISDRRRRAVRFLDFACGSARNDKKGNFAFVWNDIREACGGALSALLKIKKRAPCGELFFYVAAYKAESF